MKVTNIHKILVGLFGLILLLSSISQFIDFNRHQVNIVGDINAISSSSYPIHIAQSPNDPRFSEQTNLNQVKVPPAWDVTVGDSNQIVAIIDTGVNSGHEDLVYRIWTNNDEIPNNNKDDDNNGYIDDYQGYNFMNNTTDITDQNGHGTGIASIIAANTDNGKGMAGINWNTKIMVLKALNSAGGGEYADVASALHYATDNGARVVNMSFGTYFDSTDLQSAVDYAVNKGVTIVAAAGNNNQNQLLYPAGYDNVIAVGAVDGSGHRASFSNFGNALDVVAPGLNILMANYVGNNAYVYGSGTSFAAAHVSGLASLLLARNSTLTPVQIENVVKSTATSMGNLLEYGNGLINMASALGSSQATDRIAGRITSSSTHVLADGTAKIRVNVQVTNNDFPLNNHQIRVYIGAPVIINDILVDQRDVYVGSTDASGNVNFTLTSNVSGQKLLIFSDTTAGVSLGDLTLMFDPINGVAKYSAAKITQSEVNTLAPGEQATLWVDFRNTGNVAWLGKGSLANGQMRLGSSRPQDRESQFYTSEWLSNNRVATLQQSLVQPGEIGRFSFTIKAPVQPGNYKEYFNPVIEYITWLAGANIYWDIAVSNNGADPVVSNYNVDLIYKSANLIMTPGQTGTLQLEIKNTGIAKWIAPSSSTRGVVRVGTVQPYDRISPFWHPNSWLSDNRIIDTGLAIEPGDRVMITFMIKAPLQPGVYYESFRFVSEYITWFGPVFTWKITVQ